MTPREAAIVTAYTTYLCGSFDSFRAYAEEKLGRPVYSHEMVGPTFWIALEEASKDDFLNLKVDEKCEWSRESDDVWRSDCGLLWEFDNEETPKANNMNYCPQCGKILEEAPEYWEEDEDE